MAEPPAKPTEPELPTSIGRYSIGRLIGEGAMGRVLLPHDPVLDRDVAIKHLRGDLKIPREVRAGLITRMRHEARAAARVSHPNLVVLHDMGEDDEIGLYLVFEYVEGPTLKQRIARGSLPPAEVAKLARDLGGALTLAHEAGILHRDIKPENVILARFGGKLADFGIARIPDSTLTHQGGLMGTPAYSAPETFRAGKFSPESDQFSLAATLYEALSGERAFPGDDAVAVAAKIANDPPEPFAAGLGLDPAVDAVLGRALDRRPEKRFPSCAELGAALADALTAPTRSAAAARLEQTSAVAQTPAQARTGEPPRERTTGQVVLGAIVVVITATLLVRTALRSAEDSDPDPAPQPAASHSATVASARPHATAPVPVPVRAPVKPAPSASAAPAASSAVDPPTRASASAGAPDAGAAPPSPIPQAPASAAPSATINANPR
ncbi:MAG: serine/threonine-protein kinase [Byssovorax sp.]